MDGGTDGGDGAGRADTGPPPPPLTACEQALSEESSFGCRFYAVDLPQGDLTKPYAVGVANPSLDQVATVEIKRPQGDIVVLSVPPRGFETYIENSRHLTNINQAGVYDRVFVIESDRPIAAYQFNPIETVGAASTDASLLFPEHALADHYFAMDYTNWGGDDANFIAVVATVDGTSVAITPTAPVFGNTSATLAAGEVLLVRSAATGTSLTGSRVQASHRVAVFGGNRCGRVPADVWYCDHMEQQIFPRQALGTRYIVPKTFRGSCDVPDYVRVMADVDGTTVTVNPPLAGPFALDAGEWVEMVIPISVEIEASEAVLVGQFLRSSGGDECDHEGDPAFILQVPSDQYRSDYIFLTPPTYRTDYLGLVAPLGASVILDGVPLALDLAPVGSTGWGVANVEIESGRHEISSNVPFGVTVYGYGGPDDESIDSTMNVSYGYPAGLDLRQINPIF